MIFEDKSIILKNGKTAVLRSPRVCDAEGLISYIKRSCGETEFLARYPEERNITIEQEEAWVERIRAATDTLAITCYVDDKVVGNCEICFRGGIKLSHRATIMISVLKDYWGIGIGSAMFEEMISAAQKRGIEIIELEYMEGNERGKRLYEKFGFRIISERPNMYKLKDGSYRGEIYMQKYLKNI